MVKYCCVLSAIIAFCTAAPVPALQALSSTHAHAPFTVICLHVARTQVALTQFFNQIMMASGATTQPGPPVMSCFMNNDKRFAFLEMR